MKTKLLLPLMLSACFNSFANIGFFNITTSAITNSTATISVDVNAYNCSSSTFYLQYSTSSAFTSGVTTITNTNALTQTYTFNLTSLNSSTTYYYRFYSGYLQACNASDIISVTTSFITAVPPVVTIASISNVSSVVSPTSATISYALNANNGAGTISGILYGLTSSFGTYIIGYPASGNTLLSGNVTITGLTANTQYYYQVTANNTAGNSYSATYTFTTSPPSPAIAEFDFNNTLYDVSGNAAFLNSNLNSFVADRNGNADSAINMVSGSMVASINGLPISNNTRSVSLWIKPISISTIDNNVFMYGTQTTNRAYGFSFKPTTINNYGWANDLTGSYSFPVNTWKHIVCTYSSTGQAIVYIDGISVLNGSKPTWNTDNGDYFSLDGFNGYVDDLKIFNYALSPTEITNLFTNNTLSSSNFNQNNLKVSLHPNPATDILNIELANEVKSVEVYSLQGQKVMATTQKQVNVSGLSKGIYLVKVTDAEDHSASQKLIVK